MKNYEGSGSEYPLRGRHILQKGEKKYTKGGQEFVSKGWFYASPFRGKGLDLDPHPVFFRFMDYQKLILRAKKDDNRICRLAGVGQDLLRNENRLRISKKGQKSIF